MVLQRHKCSTGGCHDLIKWGGGTEQRCANTFKLPSHPKPVQGHLATPEWEPCSRQNKKSLFCLLKLLCVFQPAKMCSSKFLQRGDSFLILLETSFPNFSWKSSLPTSLEPQWSPRFEFQEVGGDHRIHFLYYQVLKCYMNIVSALRDSQKRIVLSLCLWFCFNTSFLPKEI